MLVAPIHFRENVVHYSQETRDQNSARQSDWVMFLFVVCMLFVRKSMSSTQAITKALTVFKTK